MTAVGSPGGCTAEYNCGVPGMLDSGEDDVVLGQLPQKDVSTVRHLGSNEEGTKDSCESCGAYSYALC